MDLLSPAGHRASEVLSRFPHGQRQLPIICSTQTRDTMVEPDVPQITLAHVFFFPYTTFVEPLLFKHRWLQSFHVLTTHRLA